MKRFGWITPLPILLLVYHYESVYSNSYHHPLPNTNRRRYTRTRTTTPATTTPQTSKRQRVVLLVGPHKTSSSSVQTNIIRWTTPITTITNTNNHTSNNHNHTSNNDNDRTTTLAPLQGWSWPQPLNLVGYEDCHTNTPRAKSFYTYYGTLHKHGQQTCIRKHYKANGLSKRDMVREFEQSFRDRWLEGWNLVIGSEAMDFVLDSDLNVGNIMLRRIMDGMPWNSHTSYTYRDKTGGVYPDVTTFREPLFGSDTDLTVVIKLRTPRTQHLVSLWHQCCMNRTTQPAAPTFYRYLTEYLPVTHNAIHSLDSLGLAQVFLNRGLRVVLLPMEGATKNGEDVSEVIACEVLGGVCTDVSPRTLLVPGVNGGGGSSSSSGGGGKGPKEVDLSNPVRVNVKNHTQDMLHVSPQILSRIEVAIRNFDCMYEEPLGNHPNLTLMYPEVVEDGWKICGDIPEKDRIRSRKDLIGVIRDLAELDGDGYRNGEDEMVIIR